MRAAERHEYALPDLLQWGHLVDSGIVLCKDGSLLAGWSYTAPDTGGLDDEEINAIAERVSAALARLGGTGWACWFDFVRTPVEEYPEPAASCFLDPVSRAVDAERRTYFLTPGAHYTNSLFWLVQFTPPAKAGRLHDFVFGEGDRKTGYAGRVLAEFKDTLDRLENVIAGVVHLHRLGTRRVRDDAGTAHHRDDLVNYLRFALTGEPLDLNLPPAGTYLDSVLGAPDFWPGHPLLLGGVRDGLLVRAIGIDGFPPESYPGILGALNEMPFPLRFSLRFIALDAVDAKKALDRGRKKWAQQLRGLIAQLFQLQHGAVNQDAATMAAEASAALGAASSGLLAFGYFTPVVVIADHDNAALDAQVTVVVKEIERQGFAARVEQWNNTEAWLGSLPGHRYPNVRRPLIHSRSLADLLPLSSPWTGQDVAPCPLYPPELPPLLVAETAGATPINVNLHVDDVGHTLIFGPTGAGKSVLLATIAMQARRYPGATICAFDKGRSMLTTVLACGGLHHDIGADAGGPAFCPLSVLETDADLAWAQEWIAVCFELQAGRPPVPGEREAIHRAMLLLRDSDRRTLTDFVATVQSDSVRDALRHYTLEGPAGRLTDADVDGIADSDFTVFEIGELMGMGERQLIPVLLYLARRFERSLHTQPAFLLLDEAWIMLGHPVFRAKIREWLKELRKVNCAVVLATQSLSDATRSGILDVLVESCPTKILLPNDKAGVGGTPDQPGPRDLYRKLELNDAQIETIKSAAKKRDYLLVQGGQSRLFDLALGPVALAFVGVSSKVDIARVRRLIEREGAAWPTAWLKERGIEHDALA